MSRIHTADVKSRIESLALLASKTFVTLVPSGSTVSAPWAVIHPSNGTDTQSRFTGPKLTQHPSFTLHLVGTTADQVGWMLEQVKAKFITGGFGIRPTITGENTGPYEWSQPIPIQYDSDVSPALIYAVVELDLYTEPA